ncbi:MAG: glycosyltransferase involved in cell wall biosynthesis [Planctomycetota bacterium]|jgi:glycosyltransferase involved in cell wall biosynthesis
MSQAVVVSPSSLPRELREKVFICIAAFHEGAVIDEVVRKVVAVYPNVVVVDDGSADNTYQEARKNAPHVLRHVVNRGQGASLQTAISYALRQGAEYIVTFDADGQHRIEDVEKLILPIQAGEADVCYGSRFLGETINMPTSKRWVLKGGILFSRLVHRVKVSDAHNGLRCLSRTSAKRMDITMDGMAHASEFISFVRRLKLRMKEIPVQIRYTEHSLAKGQKAINAVKIVADYFFGRILH